MRYMYGRAARAATSTHTHSQAQATQSPATHAHSQSIKRLFFYSSFGWNYGANNILCVQRTNIIYKSHNRGMRFTYGCVQHRHRLFHIYFIHNGLIGKSSSQTHARNSDRSCLNRPTNSVQHGKKTPELTIQKLAFGNFLFRWRGAQQTAVRQWRQRRQLFVDVLLVFGCLFELRRFIWIYVRQIDSVRRKNMCAGIRGTLIFCK